MMGEWQHHNGRWLYNGKPLTPLQATRLYCKNFCDGQNCDNRECPHYIYREGHNPSRKGIGRVRAEKAKNGTYIPSQDGVKREIIKGLRRGDELRVKLPHGVRVVIEK